MGRRGGPDRARRRLLHDPAGRPARRRRGRPTAARLGIVRGKRNYDCILPHETDTRVDRTPSVRERGFDCDVRHRCQCFRDREVAPNRGYAAMWLAYFGWTASSNAFGRRDVVVDEAHGLAG